MRAYDDLVEVRRGPTDELDTDRDDRPEQFLWRGRLWQVREVVAHWMESGAWWVGKEGGAAREVWRVAAARGRAVASVDDPGFGIFDLAFDATDGVWRLAASVD